MPCFYGFHGRAELLQVFVGIHGFIDIIPLVPHKLIPGHAIYPGTVQEHIESVAAVMRGVFCLNAAGGQGGI